RAGGSSAHAGPAPRRRRRVQPPVAPADRDEAPDSVRLGGRDPGDADAAPVRTDRRGRLVAGLADADVVLTTGPAAGAPAGSRGADGVPVRPGGAGPAKRACALRRARTGTEHRGASVAFGACPARPRARP